MARGRDSIRYLVTGGAGFIGSHFVDRLLAEGHTVTIYDNLVSGNRRHIEPFLESPRCAFIEADLRDEARVRAAMKGHDAVVHLGANTDIILGNTKPRTDLENCTIATYNVLEAMQANAVREILFASSATVYGDLTMKVTPESAGPMLPISLYGAAKLACEAMISAYCHLFGFRAWMFRFGNVVGARMGHGVIHDFIYKLRRNPKEMEILGDGKQKKNFFLVEECVDGVLYGARHATEKACDVFNLGSETTVTVTEIAQIVQEEMGLSSVKFRYAGGSRGWPGDVPIVLFDTSKMRALGWEAKHSSAEAVRIAARRLLQKL